MYNPAQELSSIAFDKIIGGALNAVVSAQNNSSMTTVNFIKSVGFVTDENGNTIKPMYVDFKYPKEVKAFTPATIASGYLKLINGGSGYTKESLVTTYEINGAKLIVAFDVNDTGSIISASILSGADAITQAGSLTLVAKDGATLGTGAEIAIVSIAAKPAESAVYQDMTLQVPLLTMLPIPFIRIATSDIELNVKINSINNSASSSDTNIGANINAKAGYKGIAVSASVELNASISHQKKSSASEEVKKEYSLNIKIHAVQDEMPVGLSRILDILEESIVPKRLTESSQGA